MATAISSDMTQAIVEAAQVQSGMSGLGIACGTGEPRISLAALLASSRSCWRGCLPASLKIAENRACGAGIGSAGPEAEARSNRNARYLFLVNVEAPGIDA
jgi:ubiquinone/menaquinone biosynthesis C-methylase UbiE